MRRKEMKWIEDTDLAKYDLTDVELTAAILLRGELASLEKEDAAKLMKRIVPDELDRDELITTLSGITDSATRQIILQSEKEENTNRMGYYMSRSAAGLSGISFAALNESASPDFIRFLQDLKDSF